MKCAPTESVRYAWADDAGDANLYNQEGFPAVPFSERSMERITGRYTNMLLVSNPIIIKYNRK